jgi:crossover junction endodeoxyribonuclease RusA
MKAILVLPLSPSTNTYYRKYNNIMVIGAEGRAFRKAVQEYVLVNKIPKFRDKKLKITMVISPRDKRKIDIDNRIKAVLDSLQKAGVFDDDFHVDHLEMIRGEAIKGGQLLVTIEEIPPINSEVSP